MQTEETPDFTSNRFPKENPFRVPDGYFDRFPAKLAERMAEEKKVKRFPFPALLRPAPLLAAAMMLVIAGVFGYRILSGPADPLTEEEISTYVYQEGIIDEIEVDDILESTEMADFSDSTTTHSHSSESDEIQRYLLEENIDEADIINEF